MQDTLDWNTTNIMINQVYPHVFHVANTVLLLAKQFICRAQGRIQDLIRGGPQIVTGLKLPFWGLSFVEFWCWGLIFGGRGGGGAGPLGPPPGSAPGARCLKTKLSVTDFTAEVKKIYCLKYYYAKAKKKTIKHKNGTICTKVVRLQQQVI